MRKIVYLTPDDRRALLNALKPGLVYTRPTSDPDTFTIAGVNLEFQLEKEPHEEDPVESAGPVSVR